MILIEVEYKCSYCLCGTFGGDFNFAVLPILASVTKFNVHQH